MNRSLKNLTDDSFEYEVGGFEDTPSMSTNADLPPGWGEVKGALDYIRGLPNNWAGNGEISPSHQLIDMASIFALSVYWKGKIFPEKIYPDGDGGIVFKWGEKDNKTLIGFRYGLINVSYKAGSDRAYIPDIPYMSRENTDPRMFQYIPAR